MNDTNDMDDANRFAFCYANISYLQNEDLNSQLETQITNLSTYYMDSTIFLKKCNEKLKEDFLNKYDVLFKQALVDAELNITEDSILSLNDQSLDVNNIDFDNIVESFTGKDDYEVNLNKFFPSTPGFLHHEYLYDNNNESLRIIKDAYAYKNTNDNYDDFKTYMEDTVSGETIDFSNDTTFVCGDESPEISMNFYCGNIANTWNGTYQKDVISTLCKNQNVNVKFKLIPLISKPIIGEKFSGSLSSGLANVIVFNDLSSTP